MADGTATMNNNEFDVVVIGGGITSVYVARLLAYLRSIFRLLTNLRNIFRLLTHLRNIFHQLFQPAPTARGCRNHGDL